MEKQYKNGYPDFPSSLEEMDGGQKAIYFGTEILHIFKSSDKVGFLQFSLFLILCGMIGNAFLVLLVLVSKSLHKTAYVCEVFRSLSDMLLMIAIAVLVNLDMFNVGDALSRPIGLLVCIYVTALYTSFEGLYKSVYMCLVLGKFTKVKLSCSCSAIASIVIFVVASVAGLFLGIMYCVNILAFVVFSFLLYFSPFILAWILEVVKYRMLRNTSEKYEPASSPSLIAEYHESKTENPHDDETGHNVVFHHQSANGPGMSTGGKIVAFLSGVVRSISFSIMTMIIVRITWVFFRHVTPVPILQSLPSIMEQLDLRGD